MAPTKVAAIRLHRLRKLSPKECEPLRPPLRDIKAPSTSNFMSLRPSSRRIAGACSSSGTPSSKSAVAMAERPG